MKREATHRALLALALLSALSSGCSGITAAKAPAQEDEATRLTREINKVRFAMDATKALIERSRGRPFLPDLYLRLAELYVEQARYQYFLDAENQKREPGAKASIQTRLLKNQAVTIYNRILEEFPEFAERDKVLFFIAHEHRELGDYDEMTRYLRRVIDDFPESAYRNEALLVLGDHHFDKTDLDAAESYYQKILDTPESSTHAMARYKLAWVRINRQDFKGAVQLFEETLEKLTESEAERDGIQTQRIDLRREALVDLVYPYTEVYKKLQAKPTLQYFRRLADSRGTYLAALNKLGKRLFLKGEYRSAGGVYRELLTLGLEGEDALEWANRLHDAVIKEKNFETAAEDVQNLARLDLRLREDWRRDEAETKKIHEELEAYARDIATKAQLAAQSQKSPALARVSAEAYEAYLRAFSDAPKAREMRQNLAEARLLAEQYDLAGSAFEAVMGDGTDAEQKVAVASAVAAYSSALKAPANLTRLEIVRARAGLRRTAAQYVERYPKDANLAAVKFNLARSYYDEGQFDHASDLFAGLVEEYPRSEEANVSAELALDALRIAERYEDMIRVGKRLASDTRLNEPLRARLTSLVAKAESRALESETLRAGYDNEQQVSAGLIGLAKRYEGSELGEKALLTAFNAARASGDVGQASSIADQISSQYPKSEALPDVLAGLGKLAADAGDFDRAAAYWAQAGDRRPKDARAVELYSAALAISVQLGDVNGAKERFQKLPREPAHPTRRDAALAFGGLMERVQDHRRAAEAFSLAALDDPKNASLEFRIGRALVAAGDGGEGMKHLKSAIGLGRGSNDAAELEAVAGAVYTMNQGLRDEYFGLRGEGASPDGLQKKFAGLAKLEASLLEVIQLQSPRWAVAALATLGAAYEDGATFLSSAPVPPGLDDAGLQQYKGVLDQKIAGLRGKAESTYGTCATKAAELGVFTRAARACIAKQKLEGDPDAQTFIAPRRAPLPAERSTAFRQKLTKNPKDSEARIGLAELYLEAGDPGAALLMLDSAPDNSTVYNLRGVAAHAFGDLDEAHRNFSLALERDRGNLPARLNRIALYRSLNMTKAADQDQAKLPARAEAQRPSASALIPGAGGGR